MLVRASLVMPIARHAMQASRNFISLFRLQSRKRNVMHCGCVSKMDEKLLLCPASARIGEDEDGGDVVMKRDESA